MKLSSVNTKELLKNIKTIFFDCDGVLWNSFGLIQGAVETVNKLKSMEKKVFFVTNNSTKTQEEYLQRFNKYGFNVSSDEILCTAYLTAVYIKKVLKLTANEKVYVIGSPGMRAEFDKAEIKHIGIGPQPMLDDPTRDFTQNYKLDVDMDVGAVCVGFDEHFSLHKIAQAMQYLKDVRIPYIATNDDSAFPMGNGVTTPGTGCIVSAVTKACGRTPLYVGKPSSLFFDVAKTICSDINPSTSLMIGDRLDTDIAFGKNCGFQTLLVLSGITDEKLLERETNNLPDHVMSSIKDLLKDVVPMD